jgi:outer membrane protein assembly factor BamB
MRRTTKPLLLAGLALLPALAAADWPQFRGDGSAVSAETGLPVKWSKDTGIKYKVALPGRGLSNPVIAGGRVYVTACSGYRERRLHVLCLDEATGKKAWERQLVATGNTARNDVTNMAAPTPCTDGKAVYALFATGDLACFEKDGSLRWYRSLVGDYPKLTNQVGMASSPVLADGVLIVPMENVGDSFLAGLDPKTGKNLWKVKRPRALNWVTPAVFKANGRTSVLFTGGDGAAAIDPKTGKERWSYKAILSNIPSPATSEGVLFLPNNGGDVRAVRPPSKDGGKPEVLWEEMKPINGGYPTPVAHGKRLYCLTNDTVAAYSADKGERLWRLRVDGPFFASPVIGDGRLYVVNAKGRTSVVSLGDTPKVVARNDLDDAIQATPAIANGCLYLRSDKYLYCVGPKKR